MKDFWTILVATISLFNIPVYSQFFDAKKIFETCADAVVVIETPYGLGTGFIINQDGFIVTNHHVVRDIYEQTLDPRNIRVTFRNRSSYIPTSVDDTPDYPGLDIAILKIPARTDKFLSLYDKELKVGEEVVAIGHPNGDFWNQSRGIISKLDTDDPYLLQHDVKTDEGNSGGPLINANGQVVAVVTGYKNMRDNLGNLKIQETGKLATKISSVIKVLRSRKISYSTNVLIYTASEIDNLADALQKERKLIKTERENLLKEREKFSEEQNQFYKIKAEFEKQRLEAQALIDKANRIRSELDNRKRELDEKESRLYDKEKSLHRRERELNEKEKVISEKLDTRIALDFSVPIDYYVENYDVFNSNVNHKVLGGFEVGLFWKFGFERNYVGYAISNDRIGLLYQTQKTYDLIDQILITGYQTRTYLALEFSNTVRIGVGKIFNNQFSIKTNQPVYSGMIGYNISSYPSIFGLKVTIDSDTKFKNLYPFVGLYFGYSLSFLRI